MPRIENGGGKEKKKEKPLPRQRQQEEGQWAAKQMPRVFAGRTRTRPSGLPPGVETLTPEVAVRRLAQMGAGLAYPSPREFNQRLRQMMTQYFPLTPMGEEFLNRINFEFMPGEPGWASSRELGAAIDPATIVHEYLHNFPTFGMRGVFAGREQARVSPFDPTEYQRRYLQREIYRPDVARRLGLQNPELVGQMAKELFHSPWHGYTAPLELSTRIPEDLRRNIYPFLQPGTSPRAYLGRPEGPPGGFAWPELVYADVAQNPKRYLDLFTQDPGFWYGIFQPRLQRTLMTKAFER